LQHSFLSNVDCLARIHSELRAGYIEAGQGASQTGHNFYGGTE
jgi:hypothetical protein